jgi:hypothetical protein
MTRPNARLIPPAIRQLINRTAHQQARAAEARYSQALFDMVQAAVAGGMALDGLEELVRDYPQGGMSSSQPSDGYTPTYRIPHD